MKDGPACRSDLLRRGQDICVGGAGHIQFGSPDINYLPIRYGAPSPYFQGECDETVLYNYVRNCELLPGRAEIYSQRGCGIIITHIHQYDLRREAATWDL